MKKTLIVLMLVLLCAMLIVSCDDNTGSSDTLPKDVKGGQKVKIGNVTWKALTVDEEGKTALLISTDILDAREFRNEATSESQKYTLSDIRKYLNGDFISKNGLSKEYIQTVKINQDSIETTSKDNTGDDYVFLLSNTEYETYKEAIAEMGNSADWWLRSVGDSSSTPSAKFVKATSGEVDNDGADVKTKNGVRPAFWYKWD